MHTTPLNIAHRGASAAAPENTLAAFRLARALGADGIELDTCLSADGIPVVIHDNTVDRTSNGKGPISKMTVAEIKKLDAGSWKDPRYAGERIPTLDEVFAEAKDFRIINVELKVGPDDPGPLVVEVLALIRRHGIADRVIISSFAADALAKVHAAAPEVRTGFLYGAAVPKEQPEGLSAQHPHFAAVAPDFVSWAHGLGQKVNAWTVDDPAEMCRLTSLGVDGIITNVPDVLKKTLAEQQKG